MEQHCSRSYLSCECDIYRVVIPPLLLSRASNPSDAEYFRQPGRPAAQPSDNWVLRFSALKKLYRLMTQYFSEVLHQPTSALEVPDLQAIAKDYNVNATLIMCRLTIAIAVQCENNKEIIERIQKLTESEQHALMRVIEQVCPTPRIYCGRLSTTTDHG